MIEPPRRHQALHVRGGSVVHVKPEDAPEEPVRAVALAETVEDDGRTRRRYLGHRRDDVSYLLVSQVLRSTSVARTL